MISRYKACSGQDTDLALAIASCAQQVVKKAGDRLRDPDIISNLLSTAYIGSCDPDAATKALWTETFAVALETTGVGSKISALRRSTLPLTRGILELSLSMSWDRRKQAIAIVNDLLASLPWSALDECFAKIIVGLLCNLRATAWQGQELVLECLSNILSKAEKHFQFDNDHKDKAISILLSNQSMFEVNLTDVEEFQSKTSGELQDKLRELLQLDKSDNVLCSSHWSISPTAYIKLFLYEIERTEADYRFCAARALSIFPWDKVNDDPAIFNNLLRKVIDVGKLQHKPRAQSSLSPPLAPVSVPVKSSPAPAKTTMGNAALFGNRYGPSKPPSRPLKRTAPIQLTKPSPPSSSGANVTGERNGETTEVVSPPAVSLSTNTIAGRTSNMDPAFRMFLIDSLSAAWPSSTTLSDPSSMEIVPSLLLWIEDCIQEEVWSVRRSSVALLGNILNKTAMSEQQLHTILSVLYKSFQEPKFVKVKLAVLDALEKSIQGENRVLIQRVGMDELRTIVRQATTDSQPSVLEAAAKLQHSLLNM
jgi:hypothetical protein